MNASPDKPLPLGLLPDWAIRQVVLEQSMIEPFASKLVQPLGLSYGLGSAGYDIRLAPELLVSIDNGVELDSHAPNADVFAMIKGTRLVLPRTGSRSAAALRRFGCRGT